MAHKLSNILTGAKALTREQIPEMNLGSLNDNSLANLVANAGQGRPFLSRTPTRSSFSRDASS